MNEEETKLNHITPAIQAAGWGSVEGSYIRMEFPITKGRLIGSGKRAKADSADYVLQYKGRNLAVIEAKRNDLDYGEGIGQAKSYAERLHVRYTYSTNGKRIYAIDMDEGTEGDVEAYPSPDELWAMTFPTENNWRDKLLSIPFEDKGGTWQPRYYQENAITKALEAIADNKTRILLTLATGTGKTAIAFQIAWKLFKSKWTTKKDGLRTPRILFLADRNILADQAFNAFSAFDDNALIRITPKGIKKHGKVPTNGSVFFTIFQSFMSGEDNEQQVGESFEGDYYFKQYPADFFDFIVIDECHRGGANDESNWRAIMDYFSPAVQLGLTATPRRDTNVDTYNYFGDPVYIYSLKEGVNDGFLTPFRVKQITSDLDTYKYQEGDVILEGEIDKDKLYTKDELDRGKIVIEDREKFRVSQLIEDIGVNEKTLVFCRTQKHASLIRNLINQKTPSRNANYCHRVTADDGDIGEQHLRDFQDNEKLIPTVLTTSQKLSTGVDAPEVRNIVLLRPVNSMIEFKQIIGRGTRLFDNKDYFTVYDFVDAHHHFQDPKWDGEPEPCEACGNTPCTCEVIVRPLCLVCNQKPCVCDKPEGDPCEVCGYIDCICEKVPAEQPTIKLPNGRTVNINPQVKTTFWNIDGQQITAEEFLNILFGDLPNFFKDEDQLRKLWSKPDTRNKLLKELEEVGYSIDQLRELQSLINAQDCDLFDVLSYVAFSRDLIERTDRANHATIHLDSYNQKQQAFLDFVLKQYIDEGVGELDDQKLPDLLNLKYHSIADAKQELGDIQTIRGTFIDFQKYLYETSVA